MKIAINTSYAPFSLSEKGVQRYKELSGGIEPDFYYRDRTNFYLIRVIEELGPYSFGYCCTLKVIHIPDDVRYSIMGYDGSEWIAEEHRTWS